MLDNNVIRQLIIEGKNVDFQMYYDACQTYSSKTFFLFLQYLIQRPKNSSVSSDTLQRYVLDETKKHGVRIEKKFNVAAQSFGVTVREQARMRRRG